MKISEIANNCGYEFTGEDREVNSILYSFCAKENSIAIVNNISEVRETKANCILTKPVFIKTDKTLIYINDPMEVASVKIANILMDIEKNRADKMPVYRKNYDYYQGENVSIGDGTIISPNVYIGNDVYIGNNCFIEPNVNIGNGTVIMNGVYIASGSSIGAKSFYHYYEDELKEFPGIGITVVDSNVNIGNNTTIQRGTFSDTYIGRGCKIGNLIDIGHDVHIGFGCKIVSQTGIASNVKIGNGVQIYGQVGISNNVKIEDFVTIMGKSLVTRNVLRGKTVSGFYARDHIEELRFQAKLRKL